MEKAFAKAEELVAALKNYAGAKIDEVKLNTAEKVSTIVANLVACTVVAIVFILFIIFAGIALAVGLGAWTGKLWIGFLIVAGIYLVLGLIIWFAKEKIIRFPLINMLLQQLYKKDQDEEN